MKDAGLAAIGVLKDLLAHVDVMVECPPQGIASRHWHGKLTQASTRIRSL